MTGSAFVSLIEEKKRDKGKPICKDLVLLITTT